MSPTIEIGDPPHSSCCAAELKIQREVSDTIAYSAVDYVTEEGGDPTLYIKFAKTYDDPDGTYSVICSKCGADLYAANLSLEEK